MQNVTDFRPEKNEFEEFSLKKANVATVAPESKPNVYSLSSIALQKKYAHIEGFFVSKIRFIFCVETAK